MHYRRTIFDGKGDIAVHIKLWAPISTGSRYCFGIVFVAHIPAFGVGVGGIGGFDDSEI